MTSSRDALLCLASAAVGAAAAWVCLRLREERASRRSAAAGSVAPPPEKEAVCPGPDSAEAGLLPGCEGCPNRSACAADKKGAPPPGGPRNAEVAEKLRDVRKKVVVLSGKGGVGKSTVTSQLGNSRQTEGSRNGSQSALFLAARLSVSAERRLRRLCFELSGTARWTLRLGHLRPFFASHGQQGSGRGFSVGGGLGTRLRARRSQSHVCR